MKLGLIMLAAGLSRRMRGPNKLLQLYRGEALLARALRVAAQIDFAERVAVTGRDAAEIEEVAASFNVRCVHNAHYMDGLGASIATGASAVSRACDAVFVALGDMPDIGVGDYRALASFFKPEAIAVPVHQGSRGHPVLFCASYLPELSGLSGDEGALSLLSRRASFIVKVETGNSGVLRDIDTPEDFQRAKLQLKLSAIKDESEA